MCCSACQLFTKYDGMRIRGVYFINLLRIYIKLLIYFLKEIETVSERKHLRGCTAAHSKADIALMSGKINVLRSDLRKLRNYAISCNHY
jgi:hypothetical protein